MNPRLWQELKIGSVLKRWKNIASKSKQRFFILKEWADTEKSYLNDLRLMREKIQKPVSGLIDGAEELFPNIEAIEKLSLQMWEEVNAMVQHWHPHKTLIANRLAKYCQFFKLYQDYCNQYKKNQARLISALQNQEVQSLQSALPLDFQSYLIKPVQRPLKYSLLLKEYLKALKSVYSQKYSKHRHLDLDALPSAIKAFDDVNQSNNCSMKRQISEAKLFSLQKMYGSIISDKKIRAYLSSHDMNFDKKQCTLHLLSDLILIVCSDVKILALDFDHASYASTIANFHSVKTKILVCCGSKTIFLEFKNQIESKVFKEAFLQATKVLQEKQISRMALFNEQKHKKQVLEKHHFKSNKLIFEPTISPSLRISIVGMYPSSKADPCFAVRFESINGLRQTVGIKFTQILTIRSYLLNQCPLLRLPSIEQGGRAIEKKAQETCSFLCSVLRDLDFSSLWSTIAQKITLHPQFWGLLMNPLLECHCRCCLELPDSLTIEEASDELEKRQDRLIQEHSKYGPFSDSKNAKIQTRSWEQATVFQNKNCPFNYFSILKNLANEHPHNFTQLLLCVKAKIGIMDFSQMEQAQCGTIYNIEIELASVLRKYFTISVSSTTRIGLIIQKIRVKLGMDTLNDYALYLQKANESFWLNPDQILQNFLLQKGVTLRQLCMASKWKIILRKWLFISSPTACTQRILLETDQILEKLKSGSFKLNCNDSLTICALYTVLLEILQKEINYEEIFSQDLLKSFRKSLDFSNMKHLMQTTKEQCEGYSRQEVTLKICRKIIRVADLRMNYYSVLQNNKAVIIRISLQKIIVSMIQGQLLHEFYLKEVNIKTTISGLSIKKDDQVAILQTNKTTEIIQLIQHYQVMRVILNC